MVLYIEKKRSFLKLGNLHRKSIPLDYTAHYCIQVLTNCTGIYYH